MHSADEPSVRVLIAEDHQVFAHALQLLLERDDRIQVVGVAVDGEQAVELAVTNHADVVMMDIAMPRLDGIGATRKLLALEPAARVLILSGNSHETIEREARAAGAAAVLLKGDIGGDVVETVLALAL